MESSTLWYIAYGYTALMSVAGGLIALAALASARGTVEREMLQIDRSALVRRKLANLHYLNQRNRVTVSVLLFCYALIGLTQGPPAVFRPATWMSLAVISVLSSLTTYAAAREWRIRIDIRRRADEIAILDREGNGS